MLKQNDYQTSYVKNLGELIKLKILKNYTKYWDTNDIVLNFHTRFYNTMVYNTLLRKIKTLTLVDH